MVSRADFPEGMIKKIKRKKKKGKHSERYPSKTTEGVYYEEVIPGLKVTPAMIEHEGHIKREKRRRMRKFKGIPHGKRYILA